MSMGTQKQDCEKRCWQIAAAAGVVFALLLMLFGTGFLMGLFWGILAFIAVGEVLLYLWCRDEAVAAPKPAAAAPKAEEKPEPAKVAEAKPEDKADATASEPLVKPTTDLPGQAELAGRKGEWKYEAAPETASEPVAPTSEGMAPGALASAREGGADNLKKIKGVGPKLESVLNGLGVYHFDQIAGWSAADVAWADENLVGFKGRVSRDDWVTQAKTLASGGETEFSKRTKP